MALKRVILTLLYYLNVLNCIIFIFSYLLEITFRTGMKNTTRFVDCLVDSVCVIYIASVSHSRTQFYEVKKKKASAL